MSKQSAGVDGATTATGDSPLRPKRAWSRSACSVLVGRPGRRTAALDVADDERQLERDGEADRLGLEREARAGGRRDAEGAAEGRAERGPDPGDLVLGLHRRHAVALEPGEGVQDVGGRRDRVGAEEERQARAVRGGDQAEGQRDVAGDVAVGARRASARARPRS